MTPTKNFSTFSPLKIKKNIKIGLFALTMTASYSMVFTSCSSSVEYVNEEKVELTQGLITEVKEMKPGQFKITDETVVPKKEDSRIIAEYTDTTRDTFTLEEAMLVEHEDGRRRGFNGVLMGGLMGYYMGKSLSSPVNSSAYASQNAYNKSNTSGKSSLNSTARRTTVKKPVGSKSGYGSSKSTRSYGG